MKKRVYGFLLPNYVKTALEMSRGYELELIQGNFPKLFCAQHVVRCDGYGTRQLQKIILNDLSIVAYATHPMIFMDILPSSAHGSLL